MDLLRRTECINFMITSMSLAIVEGFTFEEGMIMFETLTETMKMIHATPGASEDILSKELIISFKKHLKEHNL
jgi:hypothetical protein